MTDEFERQIYAVWIPGFSQQVSVVIRDHGRFVPEGYVACHTLNGWPVNVPVDQFRPTCEYKCSRCGKIIVRERGKAWIKSFCLKTDRNARLMKVGD